MGIRKMDLIMTKHAVIPALKSFLSLYMWVWFIWTNTMFMPDSIGLKHLFLLFAFYGLKSVCWLFLALNAYDFFVACQRIPDFRHSLYPTEWEEIQEHFGYSAFVFLIVLSFVVLFGLITIPDFHHISTPVLSYFIFVGVVIMLEAFFE